MVVKSSPWNPVRTVLLLVSDFEYLANNVPLLLVSEPLTFTAPVFWGKLGLESPEGLIGSG